MFIKMASGARVTRDGRFVVNPSGYQGSTRKWILKDRETDERYRLRTLEDCRDVVRELRGES